MRLTLLLMANLMAPQATAPDADLETLRTRFVAGLLPSGPTAAKAATDAAPTLLARLAADGSWPDVDYADRTPGGWKTSEHLAHLETLARAWRAGGAPLQGEAELRTHILKALDYWLDHDFRNPNWWHNQIGVPMVLGGILLILDDELTPEQRAKGAAILNRSSMKGSRPGQWTGANLTWMAANQVMMGLLTRDAAVVSEATSQLFAEIRITAPGGEGIQPDMSFHQHGPVLYAGGYGAAFTADCAHFFELTNGTRFAATEEQQRLLERYVLDGQQWMVRGHVWDYGAVGRELVRQGKDAGGLFSAVATLARLGGPRAAELKAMAARGRGETTAPLVGNRNYWCSDYMAQQRPNWLVSARTHSVRTANTDAYINGENKQSHHLSDGACLIYRSGEEYRDIFPVWNWRLIPGTTVEQVPTPLDPAKVHRMGNTRFVGGVSDGAVGLAVMDLHRDALLGHKAWAFLDDAVVCLGNGITCATDNPVLTSVNQCLLHGPVLVDGRPAEPITTRGLKRVSHDGVTYAFPLGGATGLTVGPQTGSWGSIGPSSNAPVTRDVFNLWLDHGPQARDASYVYVILPDTTEPRAVDAALAPIEVLANTPSLQAVRHRGQGLLEAAFWQPGRLAAGAGWTVTVDQACLLLARESVDGLALSLANPLNAAMTVTVSVDRVLTGEGVTVAGGVSTLRVELPGGAMAGSSVTRRLGR